MFVTRFFCDTSVNISRMKTAPFSTRNMHIIYIKRCICELWTSLLQTVNRSDSGGCSPAACVRAAGGNCPSPGPLYSRAAFFFRLKLNPRSCRCFQTIKRWHTTVTVSFQTDTKLAVWRRADWLTFSLHPLDARFNFLRSLLWQNLREGALKGFPLKCDLQPYRETVNGNGFYFFDIAWLRIKTEQL